MRRFFIVACFIYPAINCSAQLAEDKEMILQYTPAPSIEEELLSCQWESFEADYINGGIAGLQQFAANHSRYPRKAEKNRLEGVVVVNFIVNKDSSLSDFCIETSLSRECDDEVIRSLKKAGEWRPALVRGRYISSLATVRFVFKLPSKKDTSLQSACDDPLQTLLY